MPSSTAECLEIGLPSMFEAGEKDPGHFNKKLGDTVSPRIAVAVSRALVSGPSAYGEVGLRHTGCYRTLFGIGWS